MSEQTPVTDADCPREKWCDMPAGHSGRCRGADEVLADRATLRARAQPDLAALRAALVGLRRFAEAHHGDEQSHVWLHGLTVDIPDRIDGILALLSDAGKADASPASASLDAQANEPVAGGSHTTECAYTRRRLPCDCGLWAAAPESPE